MQIQTVKTSAEYAVSRPAAERPSSADRKEKGSLEQAPVRDRAEFSQDGEIFQMSGDGRAALVKSLKEDLARQTERFTDMMAQVFQKQGITAASVQNGSFWKVMAGGNYVVSAQMKEEAQAAISEDGYWGVRQTSQRIFDFAQAVAGDDVEKMREMQAAVEKGFRQAESAWGGSLPGICGDTYQAVGSLFNEYYEKNQG